jgi:hypothetical protein
MDAAQDHFDDPRVRAKIRSGSNAEWMNGNQTNFSGGAS